MNDLELMAVKKLSEVIYAAMDRVHEKRIGQIESERIHIQGDLREAIKIIRSLEENNATQNK